MNKTQTMDYTYIHVWIELTFKTDFYAESDVIYFKFDSEYHGGHILC